MAWELSGNAGTDPSKNYLGTSDAQPIIIRTGGVERLRVEGGSIDVGTNIVHVSSRGWTSLSLTYFDSSPVSPITGAGGRSTHQYVLKASDVGLELGGEGPVRIERVGKDWYNNNDTTLTDESLIVTHTENGRGPGVTFRNDGGGHFVQRFVFGKNANLPDGESASLWADWGGLVIAGYAKFGVTIGGLDNPVELSVTDGNVTVRNQLNVGGDATVSGNLNVAGDVLLTGGADCAEEFDCRFLTRPEPGDVLVMGDDGLLERCCSEYSKRVVGVASGAGEFKPAITLDRRGDPAGRIAVALLGKVFCKVDASFGAITTGDLLTTSPTPGHAMRADDAAEAFGSVIGKALSSHAVGKGLIPMLVALQ